VRVDVVWCVRVDVVWCVRVDVVWCVRVDVVWCVRVDVVWCVSVDVARTFLICYIFVLYSSDLYLEYEKIITLNNDDQLFLQFQQAITHKKSLNTKKTATCADGNPSLGLGHAQHILWRLI
jgi:hypothetical protein